MGPMLATEGESDQIAAHTASRQCVEGAGAGARASNDRKQANEGGGPIPHPTAGPFEPKTLVEYGTNST